VAELAEVMGNQRPEQRAEVDELVGGEGVVPRPDGIRARPLGQPRPECIADADRAQASTTPTRAQRSSVVGHEWATLPKACRR
jgi:hypothetical protein